MVEQIEIKAKLRRVANGFVISIPKALVDTKLFKEGQEITAFVPLKIKEALFGHSTRDLNSVYKTIGVVC